MSTSMTIPDLLRLRATSSSLQLIDVRSAGEFATGHLPGAINIPLEQLLARAADLDAAAPVVLVCQTGVRARMAADRLQPRGLRTQLLEGGTAAWIAAGHPVVSSAATGWALERQVRLGAGLLVLAGLMLDWLVHPLGVGLAVLAGAGLTFAGLTDVCLLGSLLARMPWNRPRAAG